MTAAWWRSLRGWLARSTGTAPSRLVAASRQAVAAAAASLQGE
ncbi:MAG TPA: histidine kinase, partial [Stenotrophomonas sp.]|nr:histidine kinase [Stenotrophomonas sp.]